MIAIACIVYGLRDHAHLFVRVQQVIDNSAEWEQRQLRVGGVVVENSIEKTPDGIRFLVRDHLKPNSTKLAVSFSGIPPALFQEGKEMVADGKMINGQLRAREILAKHDENYQVPRI